MRAYARIPLLVALAVTAVVVLSGAQPLPGPGAAARAAAPGAEAGVIRAEGFTSSRTYPQVALPTRIRIPALDVDGDIEHRGLNSDGSVAVPERYDVASWFDRGPRPGAGGPAVILGHVDSRDGPGIFIDLARVKKGTEVIVERADGTSSTFRITHVSRVAKTRFPTDLVYAPSLDPTLRLVTCGGIFDHSRGSYRDNVIAFADLA